jgi:nucleotide-binding universal stress UspA family protein
MKPFKKLLVPTDFSLPSKAAVELAAELSRRYEAGLTLINVYEPTTYMVPDGFQFYNAAQIETILAEFAKSLSTAKREAESAGALSVLTQQLQGIASTQIVDFARTGNYDLIVVGTHGRKGLQRALIGSVAEKVVRTAPCPVLVVPAHAAHLTGDRIAQRSA